ncbi:hypothetical protein DFAR_2120012 [Desulfarculales bacterium]
MRPAVASLFLQLHQAVALYHPEMGQAGSIAKAVAIWNSSFSPASRAIPCAGQNFLQRFTSKIACVRPAHADLEDYFSKRAPRRVALNSTVSLAGRLYEAPVPLIGKQIILFYHDHNHGRVEVLLGNRSHGLLSPLDLAVNCRVKRDHHLLRLESSSTTAPTGGSLFLQKSDPEFSNS